MAEQQPPSQGASASLPMAEGDAGAGVPEAAILDLLHKTKVDGGKKSVWAMTKETFGMAEGGGRLKADVLCASEQEAIAAIKHMLGDVKEAHVKWSFSLTPLEPLNATLDDVLRAFVLWGRKEGQEEFNVSKAFRRLESYASWMEEHRSDLEEPLVVESFLSAVKAWNMKLTHDKEGRLVWWISMVDFDIAAVKGSVTVRESLRFMVWLAHVIMLDKQAQSNGMVLMQSMGGRGMIETFTLVPMDLGTKLDRLTIGVMPVKMTSLYIFHHSLWMAVLLGMMKPFLSSKMRSRLKTVPKSADLQACVDECVGRESIPVGFAGLTGEVQDDIIFGQYVTG